MILKDGGVCVDRSKSDDLDELDSRIKKLRDLKFK